MWRIVKQSDRETMVDELARLKPLVGPDDQSQRERAVAFVTAELQAGSQAECSINLSGSRVGENNYLSIIIGPKAPQPAWVLNKSNLPKGLTREQLIAYLGGLATSNEQQSRAVAFAVGELNSGTEEFGSVNMVGDPEVEYLSLSASAAD